MSGQLIYDGDCGFCRKCVNRWRTISGGRGQAVPYQEAAIQHPEIPIEEFRRAVQYIDENGERWSGAPAIFESLKGVPGYAWLAWAYRRVPLFAPACDWVYLEVAGHRKTATWLTRKLWGASFAEPQYRTAVWVFTRVLAMLFMIAFVSFGVQVRGLIGSQGILPVASYLESIQNAVPSSFLYAPTIFWWWRSDDALEWTCWVGAALALICALGFFQRIGFAAIFALYLSLVTAGQVFMGYQWDFLLLECAFLAVFLTPSRPRVWLCQWLLFRLMFESGCVKLLSHDPVWANLTALSYHYQTQPLPTPLAWYASQAPMWVHKVSTAATFAIELLVPFLVFGPRRMKQFAALAFTLLQLSILLTGNYTCFNLLAMALCLFLLDDDFWGRFGEKLRRGIPARDSMGSRLLSAALGAFILLVSGIEIAAMFSERVPAVGQALVSGTAPFGVVNSYGLFAAMTTVRIEIEVQGSIDGNTWQAYTFRYKPGDPMRAPRWVAPHQPRLDWQMWFAALGTYRENPWLNNFMYRLLSASPDVLLLLEKDPFAGRRPAYVRALAFEYRFTAIHDKEAAQKWWRRDLKGIYFPPSSLPNP